MSTYITPAVYERTCTVLKVVDGDTVDVVADLGCDVSLTMRLRLYGVNAPEMSTPKGPPAKAFTADWCTRFGPTFYLRTVRDRQEKYGRWLADLIPVTNTGQSLCAALLASGNAAYYLP